MLNCCAAHKFRQWATKRLNEYIRKGFVLDDERLKNGGGCYFRELLQRIRDIRSSERNLYQQITDIYATSIDYDPKVEITREFFATDKTSYIMLCINIQPLRLFMNG